METRDVLLDYSQASGLLFSRQIVIKPTIPRRAQVALAWMRDEAVQAKFEFRVLDESVPQVYVLYTLRIPLNGQGRQINSYLPSDR